MVGAVRDFLPQSAVSHVAGASIATRELREALEAIRDLAEEHAPGALGKILALSIEALRQSRA